AALRDKTVLAFDADAVGRVVLERKEGTGATLVRGASGGWTLDGVDEAKTKVTAIQRFVDDVKDLKGSGVAAEPPGDLARFGLGPAHRGGKAEGPRPRGEAGPQELRKARGRPEGVRDAGLHVPAPRKAGARLRAAGAHARARRGRRAVRRGPSRGQRAWRRRG